MAYQSSPSTSTPGASATSFSFSSQINIDQVDNYRYQGLTDVDLTDLKRARHLKANMLKKQHRLTFLQRQSSAIEERLGEAYQASTMAVTRSTDLVTRLRTHETETVGLPRWTLWDEFKENRAMKAFAKKQEDIRRVEGEYARLQDELMKMRRRFEAECGRPSLGFMAEEGEGEGEDEEDEHEGGDEEEREVGEEGEEELMAQQEEWERARQGGVDGRRRREGRRGAVANESRSRVFAGAGPRPMGYRQPPGPYDYPCSQWSGNS